MPAPSAHRGQLLHLLDDPFDNPSAYEFIDDGILLVEDGHISAYGPARSLLGKLPTETQLIEHRDGLLVPGLIDTHIHFPQCDVIASQGKQLLDWLENYTFPIERQFDDKEHCDSTAEFFLDELLRNGTTTALVFGSSHPQSVASFFAEAGRRSLRMLCGKVMMDRNAPDYLCDTAASSYNDSRQLIARWHGKGRLGYAITPRFAPTSSPGQLLTAGKLLAENPSVHLHTHLSENTAECQWVQSLFPERQNYLDVYDHYGLLGKRSIFAHGIHLSDSEWRQLSKTDSVIAFCPSSNLFIGSGLFDLARARQHRVKVGIGTDIGGGDSFSLLRVLNEAYKTQQLLDYSINALQMLYLATLGGARALDLHAYIGNFELGKEADFIVLDQTATPLIARRIGSCRSIEERLFTLLMLGDDRAVRTTYALGHRVHER